MMRAFRFWTVWPGLLLLSGCLLPKPDTPIIPPIAAAPGRAAPENRTAAPMTPPGESADAMLAPATDTAMAQPGELAGTVEGLAVARIVAVPEHEGPQAEAAVEQGAFTLSLAPGSYRLALVTAAGETLRLERAIAVEPGARRQLAITVKQDPRSATVAEEVALEAIASPEATASPAR